MNRTDKLREVTDWLDQEVTWRFVYPHHLAHDETDKQVYEAEWLANSLEQLLAAERRANAALEQRINALEDEVAVLKMRTR